MSIPLLPQSFWFRLALPCRRIDAMPRGRNARLLALPAESRLADFNRLDDREPWAEVRAAWNANGLGFEIAAEGELPAGEIEDRNDDLQVVRLWVDTRDTRNVSRATRFCHQFEFRLARAKGKSSVVAKVRQKPIARAVADAPMSDPAEIASRVECLKGRWRLELFLPVKVLNGFDPETNRRLGFMYQLSDPLRETQSLAAGREFPVGENPSLWATLQLEDP